MLSTKAFFNNLLGINREDSPKITREKKSRDFDTSSIRSPGNIKRKSPSSSKNSSSIYFDESSSESAFARYDVENDSYAKGAYGKISLAKDKVTKDMVVIKHIPKTTSIRMVQNEIKAGQIIGQHPSIATFHKYLDFPEHHTLIFSFIDGQDLFSFMEQNKFAPRAESEARSIFISIMSALKHCHSKSIAHRDIKLENILVDKKGRAFLIDFGLCAFVEKGILNREWCGSDNYIAPELCRRKPYDAYKADVFSIGVTLFALLFGVFPFDGLRVSSRFHDPARPLPHLHVRFPMDVKVSLVAKELLTMMLEDDPEKRISVDDILKHKWIAGRKASKGIKKSSESQFKFIRKLRME